MNWKKYLTVYLFLSLFIGIKMAGLHVLTHDDDQEHLSHCITCELVVLNNYTPVTPIEAADISITQVDCFVPKVKIAPSERLIDQTVSPDQLFSRPPPQYFS